MQKFDIEYADNGFLVDFYDTNKPDYTHVYLVFKTWDEVTDWVKNNPVVARKIPESNVPVEATK